MPFGRGAACQTTAKPFKNKHSFKKVHKGLLQSIINLFKRKLYDRKQDRNVEFDIEKIDDTDLYSKDTINSYRAYLKKLRVLSPFKSNDFRITRKFNFDEYAATSGRNFKELFLTDEAPEISYDEIVDYDDNFIQNVIVRNMAGSFVESIWFRILVVVLIVINSIIIGLQTSGLEVYILYVESIYIDNK